jgi:hypothetical protein
MVFLRVFTTAGQAIELKYKLTILFVWAELDNFSPNVILMMAS